MSRKFCKCGLPSLPGLVSGVALCGFHYDCHQWGREWARHATPIVAVFRMYGPAQDRIPSNPKYIFLRDSRPQVR